MLIIYRLLSVFRVEFIEHGMSDLVTLRHRNVCKDGFELEGVADAGQSAIPPMLS